MGSVQQLDVLKDRLSDMNRLLEKTDQTHRIFDGIWKERVNIYLHIITAMKQGKGVFKKKLPDITVDFPSDIRRLATLNAREKKIILAIVVHMDETIRMKDDLLRVFNQIVIEGRSLANLLKSENVTVLGRIIEQYLKDISDAQLHFLVIEEEFLNHPVQESLRNAYCGMQRLSFQLEKFAKEHEMHTAAYRNIMDVRTSLERLDKGMDEAARQIELAQVPEKEKSRIKTALANLRAAYKKHIKPEYRDWYAKGDNYIHGIKIRTITVWNLTPKLLFSMMIRMGILMPFLVVFLSAAFGYQGNNVRWTFFASHPQFFVDLNLTILSFIVGSLDVIPGLALYPMEWIGSLKDKVSSLTKSRFELSLACPEPA